MAQQTVEYNTKALMDIATKRGSPMHSTGWRPLSMTLITATRRYRVVWDNSIFVTPPRRQLTERQLLELLKPQDVDII